MPAETVLPPVSPDILNAIIAEMRSQPRDAYAIRIIERLLVENKTLGEFIVKFSQRTEDPLGAMLCGVLVFRMIESQSQSDKLSKMFKI